MAKTAPLHHVRKDCRLCFSDDLTTVLELTPTPPANAFVAAEERDVHQQVFPLTIKFCESCKHVQLADVLDPAMLFENYVYVSGTSPVFRKHFEDYAKEAIDRFDLSPGSLVVDIGSNDGTLLGYFKDAGMNVLGIDPAKDIAAEATKAGIETIPEFFSDALALQIRKTYGPAQLVLANNMFAHADDLSGIAKSIRSLLADDGIFAFEVSYLLDVYENTLFDTIYHEHVAYHSVRPLAQFFADRDMELFAVQRIDSHGGSLRGFAQQKDGPHKADGSVEDLIDREKQAGLHESATLKTFGKKIDEVKFSLGKRLRQLKDQGKTIAGFGAPAKATTLLYHFDLGPDVIGFIVDDSPLKQGLLTPGMHIPVLPGAALYERNPDYVVILAWNFAEPIIRNHQEYLKSGGTFIVPLPEIQEISESDDK